MQWRSSNACTPKGLHEASMMVAWPGTATSNPSSGRLPSCTQLPRRGADHLHIRLV